MQTPKRGYRAAQDNHLQEQEGENQKPALCGRREALLSAGEDARPAGCRFPSLKHSSAHCDPVFASWGRGGNPIDSGLCAPTHAASETPEDQQVPISPDPGRVSRGSPFSSLLCSAPTGWSGGEGLGPADGGGSAPGRVASWWGPCAHCPASPGLRSLIGLRHELGAGHAVPALTTQRQH